jgi:hypothetical protein
VTTYVSLQIYPDEDGELSDRLLGFIGDGESANKKAFSDLEGQYHFLVNLWLPGTLHQPPAEGDNPNGCLHLLLLLKVLFLSRVSIT